MVAVATARRWCHAGAVPEASWNIAEVERWRGLAAVLWLGALLVWEMRRPSRLLFPTARERLVHGGRNLLIGGSNSALTAILFAASWKAVAIWSAHHRFGLAHRFDGSGLSSTAVALLAFDLWTWLWHRLNHRFPLLWRFHRMHHSDPAMDVTSANRFHPGEIVLSSLLRLPVIALVGLGFETLVLYETAMLAVVQWHHANIALPARLDRLLRVLIVTPAMHKVHHSRVPAETNSNYAALLSVWDRIFDTWRERPDPREIRFGLAGFDDTECQSLRGLLATPLADRDRR